MVQLKNSLVVCAIVFGTAMGLQANMALVGHAKVVAPCPTTGTFATLEQGGSCTIGNQTFGAFTFSGTVDMGSGSVPLAPSDLNYSTITPTINKEIGFSFSGPFSGNSPSGGAQVTLGYLVTGPDITFAGVAITGFSSSGAHNTSGDGIVMETICPGGPDVDHCRSPLSLNVDLGGSGPVFGATGADAVTFSPVDELAVFKTVTLIAPPVNGPGFSSMNGFNEISQFPEPSTMLVFGSGLLLLGIIVYRKQLHVRRPDRHSLIDRCGVLVRHMA